MVVVAILVAVTAAGAGVVGAVSWRSGATLVMADTEDTLVMVVAAAAAAHGLMLVQTQAAMVALGVVAARAMHGLVLVHSLVDMVGAASCRVHSSQ